MSETIQSLETKFRELDSKYKSVPRRKWMFRLATLVFVVFSILLSVILHSAKISGAKRVKSEYLECENVDQLREYFDNDAVRGNPEAMERLEKFTIGISNNIALAGLSRSCGINTEYRNTIGEVEAWRDIKSGKLKVTLAGKPVDTGDVKTSEVIATKEEVFFINEENNYLYKLHIKDGSQIELLSEPVQSFAVIGNQLFVLKQDGIIQRYSIEKGTIDNVVTNVQRFYISGTLIVQNGTNVYSLDLDGRNKVNIATGALLVGADKEYIYVTDFGAGDTRIIDSLSKMESSTDDNWNQQTDAEEIREGVEVIERTHLLYSIRIDDHQVKVINGTDDFIRAIYSTGEGVILDTLK